MRTVHAEDAERLERRVIVPDRLLIFELALQRNRMRPEAVRQFETLADALPAGVAHARIGIRIDGRVRAIKRAEIVVTNREERLVVERVVVFEFQRLERIRQNDDGTRNLPRIERVRRLPGILGERGRAVVARIEQTRKRVTERAVVEHVGIVEVVVAASEAAALAEVLNVLGIVERLQRLSVILAKFKDKIVDNIVEGAQARVEVVARIRWVLVLITIVRRVALARI